MLSGVCLSSEKESPKEDLSTGNSEPSRRVPEAEGRLVRQNLTESRP